jgi:hypothetical protein
MHDTIRQATNERKFDACGKPLGNTGENSDLFPRTFPQFIRARRKNTKPQTTVSNPKAHPPIPSVQPQMRKAELPIGDRKSLW